MVRSVGGEEQDGFPHRLLQGRPRHDGFIPLLLFVVLHYLLFFIVIASMRSRGPSLPLLLVPLDMELHGELTSVSNNSSAKKGSAIVLFDLCALAPLLHILCSCLAREQKSSLILRIPVLALHLHHDHHDDVSGLEDHGALY